MSRGEILLFLSLLIPSLISCVSTSSNFFEGEPHFLSSEHSRRSATEQGEEEPRDLPEQSESQLAEEELARAAEEERLAQQELARTEEQARAAAEKQRLAEEEKARNAEQQRLAQEEQARAAAEKQRLAEEEKARNAEQQRLAQEAQARAAAEKQRLAEEEKARATAEKERAMAETPTSTTEPGGDQITALPPAEETIVPDFVLSGFKYEELKVILEGEGWIMTNPGPAIQFLRKEYSPTGQSIFYLKSNVEGEYMLLFSRSAAVGIEKRAVLLKIVPREEKAPQEDHTTTNAQEGTGTGSTAETQTLRPQPTVPSVSGEMSPGQPKLPPVTPTTPEIPTVETTPPTTVVPSVPQTTAPVGPGMNLNETQPPAVVRDLDTPTTPEVTPVMPIPEQPKSTAPPASLSDADMVAMSEKDLKDVFDSLRKIAGREAEAVKIGLAFIQRFKKSNVSAEVLYSLGQLFEQPGPNVDRQRAYGYYSNAYTNYPLSPYSRLSKERMSYLEQFYLRLP